MMAARMPAQPLPGQPFNISEIAFLRVSLQEYEKVMACDRPGCPVKYAIDYFACIEEALAALGPRGQAQIWASLSVAPAPETHKKLRKY